MDIIKWLGFIVLLDIIRGGLSYNEELMLFLIYITLFLLILYNMEQINKRFLIENMVKIMDKYDISFYLKIKILQKVFIFLKGLKNRVFLEYCVNLFNLEMKKKISIFLIKCRKLNKFFCLIWEYIVKIENLF